MYRYRGINTCRRYKYIYIYIYTFVCIISKNDTIWNIKAYMGEIETSRNILQMKTRSRLRRACSNRILHSSLHSKEFLDEFNNVKPLQEDAALE
jgi:hypothetical protein